MIKKKSKKKMKGGSSKTPKQLESPKTTKQLESPKRQKMVNYTTLGTLKQNISKISNYNMSKISTSTQKTDIHSKKLLNELRKKINGNESKTELPGSKASIQDRIIALALASKQAKVNKGKLLFVDNIKAKEDAAAAAAALKEVTAIKRAEEEAAAKKQAEEEAATKKKAEEEAATKKKAEEEAAATRKKAEEEEAAAKKKAEEEATAKKKAEEEAAAKKKAEEEAAALREAEKKKSTVSDTTQNNLLGFLKISGLKADLFNSRFKRLNPQNEKQFIDNIKNKKYLIEKFGKVEGTKLFENFNKMTPANIESIRKTLLKFSEEKKVSNNTIIDKYLKNFGEQKTFENLLEIRRSNDPNKNQQKSLLRSLNKGGLELLAKKLKNLSSASSSPSPSSSSSPSPSPSPSPSSSASAPASKQKLASASTASQSSSPSSPSPSSSALAPASKQETASIAFKNFTTKLTDLKKQLINELTIKNKYFWQRTPEEKKTLENFSTDKPYRKIKDLVRNTVGEILKKESLTENNKRILERVISNKNTISALKQNSRFNKFLGKSYQNSTMDAILKKIGKNTTMKNFRRGLDNYRSKVVDKYYRAKSDFEQKTKRITVLDEQLKRATEKGDYNKIIQLKGEINNTKEELAQAQGQYVAEKQRYDEMKKQYDNNKAFGIVRNQYLKELEKLPSIRAEIKQKNNVKKSNKQLKIKSIEKQIIELKDQRDKLGTRPDNSSRGFIPLQKNYNSRKRILNSQIKSREGEIEELKYEQFKSQYVNNLSKSNNSTKMQQQIQLENFKSIFDTFKQQKNIPEDIKFLFNKQINDLKELDKIIIGDFVSKIPAATAATAAKKKQEQEQEQEQKNENILTPE